MKVDQLHRIAIVGTSSSGKTTLARQLSSELGINHKELDSFYWEPNWTEADNEIFRERVKEFVSGESWVTDGNFSQVRDLVWGRATSVIWLNYPFPLILKQFFQRSIKRSFTKEELWNGNKESLWNSILRPKSLLVWILKTYKRNKNRFGELMLSNDFPNVTFIQLNSPKETSKFLDSISREKTNE